jgi:hypothetical protein
MKFLYKICLNDRSRPEYDIPRITGYFRVVLYSGVPVLFCQTSLTPMQVNPHYYCVRV